MDDQIKTLEQQLATATGQQRVDVLNQLAWNLRITDLTRMRELAAESMELANELDYSAGVAYSLAVFARADYYEGQMDAALKKVLNAIAIMDQQNIQGEARLNSLSTLANIYMSIDSYAETLETAMTIFKLAQEMGDVRSQVSALNRVGAAYSHMGEYQRALEQYTIAIPLCQVSGNRSMEGILYLNTAIEYRELKNYPAALEAGELALKILQEVGIPDLIVSAINNLGELYLAMQNYEAALHHFHEAYHHAELLEVNARKLSSTIAANIGSTYRQQGNLDEAEHYLHLALTEAEELNLRNTIFICHENLSQLYEKQGDLHKALKHYRAFHEVKEQVFSAKNAEKVNLLMIVHQTEAAHQEVQYYKLQTQMLETMRENDHRYFEQMNKMRDELIYHTTHDLKNPLAVINTTLDLMRMKADNVDDLRRYLDRMQLQIERMKHLIADMLDLAVLDAHLANYQPFSMAELLQQVVEEYELPMAHKRIKFRFEPVVPDLYAAVDVPQMRRVFQNLLSNALKYTPERGQVTLSMQAEVGQVRVQVQDTGLGIPPADLPYIFDKFYRVQENTHLAIEGTGLGLSIVKKIVEQHQGTVQVESAPGQGSRFEVRLPRWLGEAVARN